MPPARITPIEITTKSTQILNTDVAELNVALPNTLDPGLLYYIYFGDVIGLQGADHCSRSTNRCTVH
ncbi:hypothetical protein AHF37_12449 [Paragonimus kellicotti]|nr:hypothetical protein AHF37_12449 [Paragonimus kellicotti]